MKRVGAICGLLIVWITAAAFLADPHSRPVTETDEELTPPRLVESCRVMPKYPDAELRAGIVGMVLLATEVKADGTVGTIEAKQEVEGHPAFTAAAIAAVRQWCFEPAKKNGQAVDISVVLPIRFQLDEKLKR
jgi:TonB family protein